MSIETLRAEYERLKGELDRIEGKQESAQEELARLEKEARDMGLNPDRLDEELETLLADAGEALVEVRSGLVSLGEETGVIST